MRLKTKLLNIIAVSAIMGTLTVSSTPEDILRDFLERDAAISRGVIEKPGRAEASRSERDGLIADINGRLAGEGYQLGWTQNFGLDRDLSERNGWRIHQGQDFAYDLETIMVSGKGFIAARTFDSALFGDGPIIVGGSYSSINRELAVRLNVLQGKTVAGLVLTKFLNTQVLSAPVEEPEITVQFLNGAYQPLKVCAQILSAAILVPKEVDVDVAAEADRQRIAAEADRQCRIAAEADRRRAEQEGADRQRIAAEADRQCRIAAEADRRRAEQEGADRQRIATGARDAGHPGVAVVGECTPLLETPEGATSGCPFCAIQ